MENKEDLRVLCVKLFLATEAFLAREKTFRHNEVP